MTLKSRITPKTELERSALEMVKTARRLANVKKCDPLCAGACKETLKQLTRLEKQIHKLRKKSSSGPRIYEIAQELAKLIGHLCKTLIRYLHHFRVKCIILQFHEKCQYIL